MSYEKTNWQPGDTITSEKLNHLEDGVGEAFIAPPIEGTDVGKILGVTQDAEENPVYGLVEQSDSPFFIMNFSVSGSTITTDKTSAEVIAARNAGKVCVARNAGMDFYLTNVNVDDYVCFACIMSNQTIRLLSYDGRTGWVLDSK